MSMEAPDGFRLLEHPSDVGLEITAATWEGILRQSAHGLMNIIAGDSLIRPALSRRIAVQADDRERLLVKWLSELLYLFDGKDLLTGDVKFEKATDREVIALVSGE